MIAHARLGARLLAGALALTLLPAAAFAQEATPLPHPWKLAYVKRLAEERLEHKRSRDERKAALRKAARSAARGGKAVPRGRGESARPAAVETLPQPNTEVATPPRAFRPFGAQAFVTPANRMVNSRAGDGPISGQSESSLGVFGDLMVAAWNDGQGYVVGGDTQGWATSNDGGVTWTDRGTLPHPPGVTAFEWTSDPVIAVNDKTGAFYYTGLCNFSSGAGARSGIAVVKGRWNGGNFAWGTPVIARDVSYPGDFVDKGWIVADSVSSRVFLSYTRFPAGLSRVEFQWADSSLSAFSSPKALSRNVATENGWVQGSRPVVDGNGRLYVVYYLIGQGESDYYRLCRSDNGGDTFTAPVTAESLYTNFGTGAPGFNRDMGIQFASFTADRSHGANRGRLYLSWAESINWLDDVFTIGRSGSKSEVEPNGQASTATQAFLGQALRGNVSNGADADYYAIPLLGGQHVIAAADSTGSASALRLRMLATDGVTRLTFTTFDATVNPSAQHPQGIPAGWMFTAPSSGTYYLQVESGGGTGGYRIRLGLAGRETERGRDQRDVFVGWSDDGSNWSAPTRVNEDAPGFDNWLPEITVAPDGGAYCAWYDFRDATAGTSGGESSVYLARSGDGGGTWTTLGAVTDALSRWTFAPGNIEPNQGDYIALLANASYVWPCWADGRMGDPDVFTARVPLIPNGAQVAFRNLQLGDNRASISWQVTPADTLTMRLYRSDDGGAFQYRDLVRFDLAGTLAYTDSTVAAGHIYEYRLGRYVNGVELFYGRVSVFLPSPLRLSAPRPNPVVGASFVASFSLATNEPAEFVLHDISGREVFRRSIRMTMGSHLLTLPLDSGLPQGIYVLTLRQSGHKVSTRVNLVR